MATTLAATIYKRISELLCGLQEDVMYEISYIIWLVGIVAAMLTVSVIIQKVDGEF